MAAALLQDMTTQRRKLPELDDLARGADGVLHLQGRLFCVPYYAGARAVIYRKDQYKAAGVKSTPKSLAAVPGRRPEADEEVREAAQLLRALLPGPVRVRELSFVYDYGGKIAERKNGTWTGTLDSPQAIQGLNRSRDVTSLSRANKTADEANPQQALVFSKGRVGVVHRQRLGVAATRSTRRSAIPRSPSSMGAFPMPSHIQGQVHAGVPRRLRRGRPGHEQEQGARLRLDPVFTSNDPDAGSWQRREAVPNTTSLLNAHAKNPQLAAFANASKYSFFVPTAPNWVKVENANVLRTMLSIIFTGRASVQQAAQAREQPDHHDPQQPTRSPAPGGEARLPGPDGRRRRRVGRCSRRRRPSGGIGVSARPRRPCAGAHRRRSARSCAVLGLPRLLPRPALVRAVRARRADHEEGHVGRARQLHPASSTTGSSGRRPADGRLHRGERRPDDGVRDADRAAAEASSAGSCGRCSRPRSSSSGRRPSSSP